VVVTKTSAFWDIIPLKVNWRFGGTRLHFQGRNFALLTTCFLLVYFLAYSWILKWRWNVPPKRRLTFNGLHRIISQKVVLLISVCCERQRISQINSVREIHYSTSKQMTHIPPIQGFKLIGFNSFVIGRNRRIIWLITNVTANQFTSRRRILLEQITAVETVQMFYAFYTTKMFMAVFTRSRFWAITWESNESRQNSQILLI
jgi:hypothetical protein